MELNDMTLEDIERRGAELEEEIRKAESNEALKAMQEEMEALSVRRAELKDIEARNNAAAELANGEAKPEKKIEERKEEEKMENIEVRNTKEYIDAYAEYIKTGSDAECRKLLTNNAPDDGQLPVPSLVDDVVRTAWDREGIMRRVKKSYLKGNLQIGFEISSSAADIHQEGKSAPNEENLVLGVVTLIPKSIKKWISISDEALDLNGEAFLDYVYNELTYRIAKKAADTLIADILTHTTTGTTTAPAVGEVKSTQVKMDLVAQAIAQLSDEATDPVIMMNKLTYAEFKRVQYANGYGADPFEGLPVEFNDTITAFSAATTGVAYLIVGDLGNGAQANFPNGEEIKFTYDDKSLAEADLVKIVGREYVGLGVVAPKAFAIVKH